MMMFLRVYGDNLKFVVSNTKDWTGKMNFDGRDWERLSISSQCVKDSYPLNQIDPESYSIIFDTARYAPENSRNSFKWVSDGNKPFILRMVIEFKDEIVRDEFLSKLNYDPNYEYSNEDVELMNGYFMRACRL